METNYYEKKRFWSLVQYMIHSHIGIVHLINLANTTHSATKNLPYIEDALADNIPSTICHLSFACLLYCHTILCSGILFNNSSLLISCTTLFAFTAIIIKSYSNCIEKKCFPVITFLLYKLEALSTHATISQ